MNPQMRSELPVRARPRDYMVGLGLGFALIAVAMAIVFYGLTFSIQRGIRIGKAEALEALHLRHSAFVARYGPSAAEGEAVQRLLDQADRNETSFWAVDLIDKLLLKTFDDGRIDASERELIDVVASRLRPDPGVSPLDIRRLLDEDPRLAELFSPGAPLM